MVRDALSEVGFPGVEPLHRGAPRRPGNGADENPRDLLESLMPSAQSDAALCSRSSDADAHRR
jgi:hypothetical protein